MTGQMAMQLAKLVETNYHPPKFDGKAYMGLLLMNFKDRADDLMETAMRLCLLSCKYMPTVAHIQSAIDELNQEIKQQEYKALPPPSAKVTSEVTNAALDIVTTGKAKEFLAAVDVFDEYQFARSLFPDISEDMVRRNICEIAHCLHAERLCQSCMWEVAGCKSGGFKPMLALNPKGTVTVVMVSCEKRREKN